MANSVMIEEVSDGIYIANPNSSLVSTINFGYLLHALLVESEMYDNNEWYDFSFSINLKMTNSIDEFIILTEHDLLMLEKWLDWICRVILSSDSDCFYYKTVKDFLYNCDSFFAYIKSMDGHREIITEKSQRK